jgi:hypothetical protein
VKVSKEWERPQQSVEKYFTENPEIELSKKY